MVRAKQDLEPTVAASRALGALREAAKYSGYGARTFGGRLGRRAAVVGTEGARRAGGAWYVLRVGAPPRSRPRRIAPVVLAMTAGAVAAMAVRGVVARRASANGPDVPPDDVSQKPTEPESPQAKPVPAAATAVHRSNDGAG